jgi:hypothetical protein
MNQLSVGDKVTYVGGAGELENGIVKELRGDGAFVVYRCGGDWDNYQNYTGAFTAYGDLVLGWRVK